MATYGDLKTAIIEETHRDDLLDEAAGVLTRHIQNAIDYYSTYPFWFNVAISTITTVADTATLAHGVGSVQRVVGLYGSSSVELAAAGMDDFDIITETGFPRRYLVLDGTLRFWPVPDAAYSLTVYGTPVADNLVDDEDSNVWTNEGARLIAARAKMTLNSGYFRDGAANTDAVEMEDELRRLRAETWRRGDTRLVMRSTGSNGRAIIRAMGV